MSPRDRILARRAKFIAAALAASGAVACGNVEDDTTPAADAGADLGVEAAACLSAPIDGSVWDTGPAPCLSDTGPTPCLEPPLDAGEDVSADAGEDTFDAEPAPCLKVAPDSGFDSGKD